MLSIFSCVIHLYVFFGEMSVQFFGPFFDLVFVVLALSCISCLYILEINSLSVVLFATIFSHSEGCLFTSKVSQLYTHVSTLFRFYSQRGHYRVLTRVLRVVQQVFISYVCYIYQCVYVSPNLPVYPSPLRCGYFDERQWEVCPQGHNGWQGSLSRHLKKQINPDHQCVTHIIMQASYIHKDCVNENVQEIIVGPFYNCIVYVNLANSIDMSSS